MAAGFSGAHFPEHDLLALSNNWEGAADDAEIARRNSANVRTEAKVGGGGIANLATLDVLVLDDASGDPIDNATVSLNMDGIPVQSGGGGGNYVFPLIPQGTYRVTARANGYVSATETVAADGFIVSVVVGLSQGVLTLEDLAERLAENFSSADTNDDGLLSYTEALPIAPELTAAQFNQIDSNSNDRLSREELEAVGTEMGCSLTGKGFARGIGRHIGDVFLLSMALMTLLSLRGNGREPL